MKTRNKQNFMRIGAMVILLLLHACRIPTYMQRTENNTVPKAYNNTMQDSLNSANMQWKLFFTDPYLVALIDTALKNNQELNIVQQEILIAQNEIRARKGEYLPFLTVGAGAGVEKAGRYTRNGSVEENLEIEPGREFPDPLPDLLLSANFSWELDVWKKMRNAKKAATLRYLASIEGRNYLVTTLVAEIANSYFELMAFDNELIIIKQYIDVQQDALKIVKQEKSAAKVTELAVRKFEAEVLKNQSKQFYIQQKIVETENRINYLVGRFPQTILRNSQSFGKLATDSIYVGIPSQLLVNRPDIQKAELALEACKLDVKAARANFYPTFRITGNLGSHTFDPKYISTLPQSLIYGVAADLVAPLINKNAIKATYANANAKQIQAVFDYERTILNAYIEVANQMAKMENLKKSYAFKDQEVQALTQSITISINLFKSAKADYMEVLLTQRDALEARIELIETKEEQMHTLIDMYQALGGGWK